MVSSSYLNERISANTPFRSYRFQGEYHDIAQLKDPGEKGFYVNQGQAGRTVDGTCLESEGFADCSALIIQSKDTDEAFMAHIVNWDLTDDQYRVLEQLNPGDYVLTAILGGLSRVGSNSLEDPSVSRFPSRLDAFQISATFIGDIGVETGRDRFSVSYNPKDRAVRVITRKDALVREYRI